MTQAPMPPAPVQSGGGTAPGEEAGGLQGPEFATGRGVPIIQAPEAGQGAVATEEHHAPVSEAFAAKPTSAAARSPITMSNKRTRLIVILAAVAALIVTAVVILPGGGAEGTPLSLQMAKGDSLTYHVKASIDGSVSGDATGKKDFTMDLEGDTGMSVTGIDADGVATIAATTNIIYVAVEPQNVNSTGVPETVEGELQVASDGSVVSGSPGLAAATIGIAPPGWDSLFPVLPSTASEAGDTWSEEVNIPFVGRQTLTAKAEYTLLEVKKKDGKEIAVISPVVEVPIDVSATYKEVLASTGGALPADLTEDFDPTYAIKGDMDLEATYWIDSTGVMQSNYTVGKVDMTTTWTDAPGVEGQEINITGDMTVSIRRTLPREAPAEQSPADEQGAVDTSPSVETG